MGKRLTREEKLRLIDLSQSGISASQISHQLGISESQVRSIINRYNKFGIPGLFRPQTFFYSEEFKQEVISYYRDNNLSLRYVSDVYQISSSSLCKWIQFYDNHSIGIHDYKNKPITAMTRKINLKPKTELEKLILENERLRTENALLKKVKALVEERDARLREIGRKPSKN